MDPRPPAAAAGRRLTALASLRQAARLQAPPGREGSPCSAPRGRSRGEQLAPCAASGCPGGGVPPLPRAGGARGHVRTVSTGELATTFGVLPGRPVIRWNASMTTKIDTHY